MTTTLPPAVQRKVARSVELTRQVAAAAAAPAAPATAAALPATPPATPAAPSAEEQLKALQQEKLRLENELKESTQREKVTRGRYDAEVPRLRDELKTVKDTLAELERTSKPVQPGEVRSITEADRAFAGEQMVTLIAKAAREIAQEEINRSLKPVNERVNLLQQQSEAGFFATLDFMCPDWEKQNDDPAFLHWLNGTDPGTGRSRMDRLKTAEAHRQGYLSADIFNAFREKREIGARAPASPGNPPDLTPPSDGAAQTPAVTTETEGRIISRAEITNFYREKREGRWKGREDEARAFEQEIFAARSAGRVR